MIFILFFGWIQFSFIGPDVEKVYSFAARKTSISFNSQKTQLSNSFQQNTNSEVSKLRPTNLHFGPLKFTIK